MPPRASHPATTKRPSAARSCGALCGACIAAWIANASSVAADPSDTIELDRSSVIALVRERSPNAAVARARAAEAEAARTGADIAAPINPELSVVAGPRFYPGGTTSLDFVVGVSWPFDLSGAPKQRSRVAEDRAAVAQAESSDAQRMLIAEALDAWISAASADKHLELEQHRAELDTELLRIVTLRRDAGVTGDADVALAAVVRAEGAARLRNTEAERDADYAVLRARLGLPPDAPMSLRQPAVADVPSIDTLLAALPQRPDVRRARLAVVAADSDAELQRRIAPAAPRVVLIGERSPEYAAHAGLDVPLPVYQRNQTNTAIAAARMQTSRIEAGAIEARAQAEVRAGYARMVGARAAALELENASAAIDDVEHLATRAYELGQAPLAGVVAARREAITARAALVDARIAFARARIAADVAAGAIEQ